MAEFPAMPLWTDAYLADTRHLSDVEHGRYLLLLIDMWRAPSCRFPNDMAWLQRRFRRTPEQFNDEIQPLLDEFCQCDGNWWTQKKLQKVWQHVQNTCQKQRDRAKLRWDNENTACHGNAAPAMPPKAKAKTLDSPQSATETTSPTQTAPPSGGNGYANQKSSDKGSRLKEDWAPSEAAVAHCREDLGCPADVLNREFASFMDWGLSATGPVSRKRNWDRAFINWIRRVMNGVREQEARERRWAEQRARH